MNTKIVQKCGCYEGDCVEILGLETPLYACFTCGYAGVTPSGADNPHEDEVHVHDLLAEVKRLRSVKIRQVSCRNGVVEVVLKDEDGNLYTYQAPAVDTVVDFGVSHLEPVFERPEGMGGGYVTGWTEQPTPESKPLWFESSEAESIELMPDETEESE